MECDAGRYNIYANIHKALRVYMAQTLQLLGAADWSDRTDATGALAELRGLLALCRSHLEHENLYVHAAMDARRPGAAAQTAEEHAHHVSAIDTLLTRAAQLEAAPISLRHGLGHDLYLALAMFVAENYEHMDREETANCRVLWDAYDDAEIHGIEAALVASMSPEASMQALHWMLPNIAHPQRVALLSGMRSHAPAEIFESVLALAFDRLSERDRGRLEQALASGAPQASLDRAA